MLKNKFLLLSKKKIQLLHYKMKISSINSHKKWLHIKMKNQSKINQIDKLLTIKRN